MKVTMRNAFRTALLASAAAAASLSIPTVVQAQTSETEVGEVVVTGSRIRRSELTAAAPIQVITSETMEERGFTNVADAMNEMPSMGVPVNPAGDQGSFGVGRNFVNLFNLGTNRTLTLVNGRRFVGGNPASIFTGAGAGGQVDLNVIPTGLIDRIETVQATGGAVYGSDAVAGVVNIITKNEFEGVEIDGRYSTAEPGDYEDWRARITAGRNFLDDRLSVTASYEYNETGMLANSDREITARAWTFANNPLNTSGSDGRPGQILIPDRRVPETTLGGLPLRSNSSALSGILTMPDPNNPGQRVMAQFAPNGALVPYNPGTLYQASIAQGGEGLYLAALGSLMSPTKRHVATSFIEYDITDNIRANVELFYSTLDTEEPFNQPIYNAPLFGPPSVGIPMSTANPFLSAQARSVILSQPTPLPADPNNPGERIFTLSRSSVDIGNNKTTSESETFRGVLSFEGDLEFMDRDFFWGVAYAQGQAWGEFSSPNINQQRFLNAIDAVSQNGTIVCRNPAARAEGCAPLNLFGFGAPSQAALDYVQVEFVSEFKIIQTVYEANFGGDILELPGGTWSFAAGFEARYEKSDFNPNDPQEAGVGRQAAISAVTGKYNTKEFYGETLVPVFGGDFSFPLLHRLEFEAAYRKIDHSEAGKDDAWSLSGRWYPIPDLMFRAQKSRSFRAPGITELFLPTATSFVTANDPCHNANINSGPNPAARAANCAAAFTALGLPANFNLVSQVQAATVQGSTEGNPDLENEIAKQWSVGFVYQPSFVPGLALTFDWVNIQLTDAIFNFGLAAILQVCYDSPTPPADACSRFQRGNSTLPAERQGQVLTRGEPTGTGATATGPRQGFINAGYINFEGATFGVDWRIDLTDALGGVFSNVWGGNPGFLNFNYDLMYVERNDLSVTGLGFDLNRSAKEIGDAQWRWKLETTYVRDPISVVWTLNWIDESKFNADFTPETRLPLKVKEYFLNDLAVTIDLADATERFGIDNVVDDARLRFVVRNLFDTEPPFGAGASAVAPATYDFIGRQWQVGLTARF